MQQRLIAYFGMIINKNKVLGYLLMGSGKLHMRGG
jgi:hypothetical protein